MKTKKYREKIHGGTFFVCSTYADRRAHDCIKGWGKVSPTGKTILWDSWARPSKPKRPVGRPRKDANLPVNFEICVMPVIKKVWPALILSELVGTQPYNPPDDKK